MARAICVQTSFVILCFFILSVQHSRARYSYSDLVSETTKHMPQESLVPLRWQEYQNCTNGICYNTSDYPENKILKIMQNTTKYRACFGTFLNSSIDITQIDSRSSFDTKVKKLCDATIQTHTPRVLRNLEKNWKFVVNVEGYYQRFQAEICSDRCSVYGYECGQSYQEIYLLAFENGMIELDKFSIPTTCTCDCKESFSSDGLKI